MELGIVALVCTTVLVVARWVLADRAAVRRDAADERTHRLEEARVSARRLAAASEDQLTKTTRDVAELTERLKRLEGKSVTQAPAVRGL